MDPDRRRVAGTLRLHGRTGGLALLAALATCDGTDASDVMLVEVARIELKESPDDPIVSIGSIGRRPGGGYIVPDRHAGKVRLFDPTGNADRAIGGPGSGPGELSQPTGAVELPDGRVAVVQRADARLTIFRPDGEPVLATIPGQYGFSALPTDNGFVAGVATRDTRVALFDADGVPLATFGARDPAVAERPFWIFFAEEQVAVVDNRIAVVTSLFPTVRMFDLEGDSVGAFDLRPTVWEPVAVPPVSDLSAPGSRERLERWATSFTIVHSLATVADSLLVVEYGRFDPRESDPYFAVPTTVDVYGPDGEKLAGDLNLPGRVVGGGARLLVLASEPPEPWTVAVFEWAGGG